MIMVFSLRRCFGTTAKNGKVSPSPASAPNTRMHMLSMLFESSCIWHKQFYGSCLPPLDRKSLRWSLSLVLWGKTFGTGLQSCSGCLVGPISFGFITRERSDCKDLLHITCEGFFGVLSQKPNYRMTYTSWEELTNLIRSIHWIFSWTLYLGD